MSTEVTARAAWSLSPHLRKLALTVHVTFSVGWMGAVIAFLILGIAGRTTDNPDVLRGAYFAMNLIGEAVIVPTSLVALVTGSIQGLGTRWGLFKYNWVTTKLVLTVLATLLLMLHQFTAVAAAAKRASALAMTARPDAIFGGLRTQLVVDASLAIAVLLVTTVLSIYKPWGLIMYERREQTAAGAPAANGRNSTLRIAILAGVILAGMIAIHLATGWSRTSQALIKSRHLRPPHLRKLTGAPRRRPKFAGTTGNGSCTSQPGVSVSRIGVGLVLCLIASGCSSSRCAVDCAPGDEPVPNACTCRPVPDAGRTDARDAAGESRGSSSGDGGSLASCTPGGACGARGMCIEGCPASAKPSIGTVGGICSVPGRDSCGCGVVLDTCQTPGTACLMPACCDYPGICVTPGERADICSRPEGAHFDCTAVDAGAGAD